MFYKSNLSSGTKAPQIEQTAGANWPSQPCGNKGHALLNITNPITKSRV